MKNETLISLLKIIKKENLENVIDFIELFPFTGAKGMSKLTQSHVFEALWFIIFLMSYDDLRKDNFKRIFKTKLETGDIDNRKLEDILNNTNVNESHKSGIADIYFEHVNINKMIWKLKKIKLFVIVNILNMSI